MTRDDPRAGYPIAAVRNNDASNVGQVVDALGFLETLQRSHQAIRLEIEDLDRVVAERGQEQPAVFKIDCARSNHLIVECS